MSMFAFYVQLHVGWLKIMILRQTFTRCWHAKGLNPISLNNLCRNVIGITLCLYNAKFLMRIHDSGDNTDTENKLSVPSSLLWQPTTWPFY